MFLEPRLCVNNATNGQSKHGKMQKPVRRLVFENDWLRKADKLLEGVNAAVLYHATDALWSFAQNPTCLKWHTPDGTVLPILDPPYFKHILKSFVMSISLSSVFNPCAQLMPKSQSSLATETLMAWPVPAQWRYGHKYLRLEDHTMKFPKVSFWLLGIALVALFIAACGGAAAPQVPAQAP